MQRDLSRNKSPSARQMGYCSLCGCSSAFKACYIASKTLWFSYWTALGERARTWNSPKRWSVFLFGHSYLGWAFVKVLRGQIIAFLRGEGQSESTDADYKVRGLEALSPTIISHADSFSRPFLMCPSMIAIWFWRPLPKMIIINLIDTSKSCVRIR